MLMDMPWIPHGKLTLRHKLAKLDNDSIRGTFTRVSLVVPTRAAPR